eukprot:COSAG01_NODE_5730_length_4070_cov_3.481994_2_plen_82_part_00
MRSIIFCPNSEKKYGQLLRARRSSKGNIKKKRKMNVDGPDHYTGAVECIGAMAAAYGTDRVRSFCQLNSFKYIWRLHTSYM